MIDRIRARHPELDVEEQVIHTRGDHGPQDRLLGDGIFVKEIQAALASGQVDIAVHSLKDLPTQPAEGTSIAAIPERADPRDCLVGARLADLPKGATVGTGSQRRSAQLKGLRPDLEVVAIRGNVPTRLAAVGDRVDAVMLAAAGLERLGLVADEIFAADVILPAPGQGAIAIEVRQGSAVADQLAFLHDASTRDAVVAERVVLSKLGGGCLLPLGAWGRIVGDELLLDARVVSPDGSREARGSGDGPADKPLAVARRVADALVKGGAKELLADYG